MPDEILTIVDVAKLLKVAYKTVYTMAQKAELPCFKVRGQWRFRRRDLDSWMAAQVEGPGYPGAAGGDEDQGAGAEESRSAMNTAVWRSANWASHRVHLLA
jgi:excisionase family DNA binding protein